MYVWAWQKIGNLCWIKNFFLYYYYFLHFLEARQLRRKIKNVTQLTKMAVLYELSVLLFSNSNYHSMQQNSELF